MMGIHENGPPADRVMVGYLDGSVEHITDTVRFQRLLE